MPDDPKPVDPPLPPLPPKTTAEEDKLTAGQRRINIIWEATQAVIAIVTVFGTLYIAGSLVLRDGSAGATAFLLLSNAFFMIVTAYFQRTNHTRQGGVGGDKAKTDR